MTELQPTIEEKQRLHEEEARKKAQAQAEAKRKAALQAQPNKRRGLFGRYRSRRSRNDIPAEFFSLLTVPDSASATPDMLPVSGEVINPLYMLTAPQPTAILVITPVDINNTRQTVNSVALDSFNLLEQQRLTLLRMQHNPLPLHKSEVRYSVYYGYGGNPQTRDSAGGFSLAMGASDQFSLGAGLDHSFHRHMPKSYQRGSASLGGVLFAEWHTPTAWADNQWYVRSDVAVSHYHASVLRRVRDYTEPGRGQPWLHSWGFTVQAGQRVSLSGQQRTGWHLALRRNLINQDGWQERDAEFPFTFQPVSYRLTSALAGADYSVPLGSRLRLTLYAEIEHDLSAPPSQFHASAPYIGSASLQSQWVHSRGKAGFSLDYPLPGNLRISFSSELSRSATGNNVADNSLRLTGSF